MVEVGPELAKILQLLIITVGAVVLIYVLLR